MFEELLWRIVIGKQVRMQQLEREALEHELTEDQLLELGREHGRINIEASRIAFGLKFPGGHC